LYYTGGAKKHQIYLLDGWVERNLLAKWVLLSICDIRLKQKIILIQNNFELAQNEIEILSLKN